MTLQNNTKF